MRRGHLSFCTILAMIGLACWLVANVSAQSQPAGQFVLDPAAWPAGVASPAQYDTWLQTRLADLQARVNQLPDPAAKGQACLDLALFALTRGIEPALSKAWLGAPANERERNLSAGALKMTHEALSLLERIVHDKTLGSIEARSLEGAARRLGVAAALVQSVLGPSQSAEALKAAVQADACVDCLDEATRPAWDLFIAACLEQAGRGRDAQLRLQNVLRTQKDAPVRVPAQVLSCRVLAHAGDYAAAVALVSEYLQAIPATDAPSPAGSDQAKPEEAVPAGGEPLVASASRPAASSRVARCTLLLVKANLLAEWANHLAAKDQQPYSGQTIEMLKKHSAECLDQAGESGPYLVRLQPVLESMVVPATP